MPSRLSPAPVQHVVMANHARSQYLDVIRALAIAMVLIAHFFPVVLPGASFGVSVFFALSGFLVTLSCRSHFKNGTVASFYVLRFTRVWPPLLFVVVIQSLLLFARKRELLLEYISRIPNILLFMGNANLHMFETGVFWTLVIEFWFYALLPAFFVVFRSDKNVRIAMIVSCTVSAVALIITSMHSTLYLHLMSIGPASALLWLNNLMFGAIAALQAKSAQNRSSHEPTVWAMLILTIVVSALFWDAVPITFVIGSILVSAFTSVWIYIWSMKERDLPKSPITYLGTISYSVYLLHGIFIDYGPNIPWPSAEFLKFSKTWVLIALSIAAAAVMRQAIEIPSIRFGRRLASRLGRPSPGVSLVQ